MAPPFPPSLLIVRRALLSLSILSEAFGGYLNARTRDRYVKKIEKLQFQLEELMYEKDKIAYQWANAQKVRDASCRGTRFFVSAESLFLKCGEKKPLQVENAFSSGKPLFICGQTCF